MLNNREQIVDASQMSILLADIEILNIDPNVPSAPGSFTPSTIIGVKVQDIVNKYALQETV